jgi:hypothetical protein
MLVFVMAMLIKLLLLSLSVGFCFTFNPYRPNIGRFYNYGRFGGFGRPRFRPFYGGPPRLRPYPLQAQRESIHLGCACNDDRLRSSNATFHVDVPGKPGIGEHGYLLTPKSILVHCYQICNEINDPASCKPGPNFGKPRYIKPNKIPATYKFKLPDGRELGKADIKEILIDKDYYHGAAISSENDTCLVKLKNNCYENDGLYDANGDLLIQPICVFETSAFIVDHLNNSKECLRHGPTTAKPDTNTTVTTVKPDTKNTTVTTVKPDTNTTTVTTVKPDTKNTTLTTVKPDTKNTTVTTMKPNMNTTTVTAMKPDTNTTTSVSSNTTNNGSTTCPTCPTCPSYHCPTVKPLADRTTSMITWLYSSCIPHTTPCDIVTWTALTVITEYVPKYTCMWVTIEIKPPPIRTTCYIASKWIYPETTPMSGKLETYSTCVTVPPKTGCTDCYPILICSECTSTSLKTLPSGGSGATPSGCPTCPTCKGDTTSPACPTCPTCKDDSTSQKVTKATPTTKIMTKTTTTTTTTTITTTTTTTTTTVTTTTSTTTYTVTPSMPDTSAPYRIMNYDFEQEDYLAFDIEAGEPINTNDDTPGPQVITTTVAELWIMNYDLDEEDNLEFDKKPAIIETKDINLDGGREKTFDIKDLETEMDEEEMSGTGRRKGKSGKRGGRGKGRSGKRGGRGKGKSGKRRGKSGRRKGKRGKGGRKRFQGRK